MTQLICLFIWILRKLFALRYKITVKGLDALHAHLPQGMLFLPNHPAEIDPILLEAVLWPRFKIRPLVIEHFYYLKGFRFFLDLVGALPLPSMDRRINKWRQKKIQTQVQQIVDQLNRGENFLIYPSGRLKLTGLEVLGGASLAHYLLQQVPNAMPVLVRTTGLWGSQFSRALGGASPDFGKAFWQGVKILLKNGIFFAPRRPVLIEIEPTPSDLPRSASRLEFNRYLEEWYNRYPNPGPEPLSLVSYAFWKEELPSAFAPQTQDNKTEARPVSQQIQQEVFTFLSKVAGVPADKIERQMHLSNELGLDSLDVAQLYVFLDQQYGAHDLIPGDLLLVEDVLQAAAGYRREREEGESETRTAHAWPEEPPRLPPRIPEGQTIQEAFLKSMDRNRSFIACADGLSPPLTYRRLKMAALLLAHAFHALPGEKVGVLLPSSVGAYLVILSVLLAKKVPVMLNWTTGVRALDHAAELTQLQTVITSSKFLDRLDEADLGAIEEKFCFVEEIREKLSWKDKLRVLWLQCFKAKTLLRKLSLQNISSSAPAVILFTSGTESLPKGVPLSHENLLSNQRACLAVATLTSTDILYGVLPPFHSFGFSVTGILPLLAGLKICYAPDPTDSHALAKDIAEWKPTLFFCAPSFIRALFRIARPDELQSLRLIVTGAEKAPQELFDFVRNSLPQAQLLEGYGITECSPVVALDRPGTPHCGVGKPLGNVALQIVDLETRTPLPVGQEGEICIAGPSVFAGYVEHVRDPFLNLDGKQWYLSGDRGSIDAEGHLLLSGRLKRFAKIGGEMVSLGGLEEELMRLGQEKGWRQEQEEGPCLAVSAREGEGDKTAILLFTILAVSKEEVNAALRESGWGRIVKIAEVHRLAEIPLTGTGKTDYRSLEQMRGPC